MKAVRLHAYGSPESLPDSLRLDEVPVPALLPNQVLIKTAAASVNPVDWKIREGYMLAVLPLQLPYTLGCDLAGEIVEVGSAVSRYRAGEVVYGYSHLLHGGAFAEFAVLGEHEVALKPSIVSAEEAAGFPVATITAWEGLFTHGHLQAGQKVLILGGSGGVGTAAIQLARWKGAQVYATASTRNQDYLRGFGAEAIDYSTQSPAELLSGVDLIFDTIGGPTGLAALPALKAGGAYVTSVPPLASMEPFTAANVRAATYGIQPSGDLLRQISAVAETGVLHLPVERAFSLEQFNEALESSKAGRTRGKLILRP
jgi:NADPH:quinone reductase-like Zn-dependent oxidoreductase